MCLNFGVPLNTLGQHIDEAFLSLLERVFSAQYMSQQEKIVWLSRAIGRLDILRFFLQLAWEGKYIPHVHYAKLIEQLEECGKMLGGWRKGLQTKTPTEK